MKLDPGTHKNDLTVFNSNTYPLTNKRRVPEQHNYTCLPLLFFTQINCLTLWSTY